MARSTGEDVSSPMEEDESGEEDDDFDGDLSSRDGKDPTEKPRHAITGRGVTLAMLMQDGIMEPGEELMSLEYLGQSFTADLLPDGKILWKEENMLFNSPSAWAIHCKKIVNPAKKSGCGWASVKYRGKKLDAYKSLWFRRQRLQHGLPGTLSTSPLTTNGSGVDTSPFKSPDNSVSRRMPDLDTEQDAPLDLSMPDHSTPTRLSLPAHTSVRHSSLGRRNSESSRCSFRDPNTLVACTAFETLGKIQPFMISIYTNSLLLIDFHCHLTTSEVVGYLAGKWDPATQHLSVLQAFPCRCRLGDKEHAILVEEEIRQNMLHRGLTLVGWYHSHPKTQPDPTIKDIDAQMEYQLKLKGVGHAYHPSLGLIISPYHDKGSKESAIKAYWVMPPPEQRPSEYPMPMDMVFNTCQDMFVTQDVLTEMKWLCDFYRRAPDFINFSSTWNKDCTYLDKVKASLAKKFPRDATDNHFLEYVHNVLSL